MKTIHNEIKIFGLSFLMSFSFLITVNAQKLPKYYVDEILADIESGSLWKTNPDMDSIYGIVINAVAICKNINYRNGLLSLYYNLGTLNYYKNNLDSALFYFNLSIEEANILCDSSILAKCHYWKAISFYHQIRPDSAEISILLSKELATRTKQLYIFDWVNANNAENYPYTANYKIATEEWYNLIRDSEQSKDTFTLIYNYSRLSKMYGQIQLYDNEMGIVYTMLKLLKNVKDSASIWYINYAASHGYYNQKMYDSAIFYTQNNILLYGRYKRMTMSWMDLANTYIQIGKIDSAEHYFKLAMDGFIMNKRKIDLMIYVGIGRCYLKNNDYLNSYKNVKILEKSSKNMTVFERQLSYEFIHEYYEAKGQYSLAYKYLKKYHSIIDNILNRKNTFSAGLVNLELERSKMNNQIEILTKDKLLSEVISMEQRQQKGLAYTGAAVLLLFGIYGFNRFRKSKELKSREALLSERLRISRDLHDEVGTTLSGIVMYSHLAMGQAKDGKKEVENSINIVQETASEMVNKLNDVVWLVNPMQDQLDKLIAKLEGYAIKLGTAKQLNFNITVPDEIQHMVLPIDVRRNIYFICKEAINNAIKYSDGTTLDLAVSKTDQTLEFKISDNGKGFDPGIIKRGNGLDNMQKRAEEINAQYHQESVSGIGTIVTLRCKLP